MKYIVELREVAFYEVMVEAVDEDQATKLAHDAFEKGTVIPAGAGEATVYSIRPQ